MQLKFATQIIDKDRPGEAIWLKKTDDDWGPSSVTTDVLDEAALFETRRQAIQAGNDYFGRQTRNVKARQVEIRRKLKD